jgi:hypothetical protein
MVLDIISGQGRSGPVTVTAALVGSDHNFGKLKRHIQQRQKPTSTDNISQTEGETLVITCSVHAPELVIERKCQSCHGHFNMRLHVLLKHQEFEFRWSISSWHDDVGTSTLAPIQNIAHRLLLSWSTLAAWTRFSHSCSTFR